MNDASNGPRDLAMALQFLNALDPNAQSWSFQLFDDNAERKSPYLNKVLHGSLRDHRADLIDLNKSGAGVFVTVNQTDGTGRRTENITRVRAVFADLDGASLDPVKVCKLKPHIIVATSPGRYHAYWRVDGLRLDQFEGLQKAIAARFGSDPSVHDLSRVMRLPGFRHRKGTAFAVQLIEVNNNVPYTSEKILAEFPPSPEKTIPPTNGRTSAPIPTGERNNSLMGLAGAMVNRGTSSEAVLAAIQAENNNRCDPPLPEEEVAAIAKSVERYRGRKPIQTEPNPDPFPSVTPWPEPVDGEKLLDDLVETISRHVVLPDRCAEAIALWIVHAHAHDASDVSPILTISSPEKRCGKTTLLNIIAALVPKPLPSGNITPAAIYRSIKEWKPTLIIDEGDTFVRRNEDLRGVLDTGHSQSAAFVIRCVGDSHDVEQFPTWAPKVISLIGNMHPTLEDRSIKIPMQRRLPSQSVERIPRDKTSLEQLKRKIARWVQDNMKALSEAYPDVPPQLHDRAADNWRPLISIADLAGGKWPAKSRWAASHLERFVEDDDVAVRLLASLKNVFDKTNNDRITSADLIEHLVHMEDEPWPEFKQGKPITPPQLARVLKKFGVRSKQLKFGNQNRHGYELEQFADAFARYIDVPPVAATPLPSSSSVVAATRKPRTRLAV